MMTRTISNSILLTLFALWLGTSAPTKAQESQDDDMKPGVASPALLRFMANSQTFDDTVTEYAKKTFLQLNRGCQQVDKASRQLPYQYNAPVFAAPEPFDFAPPTSGQWLEHYTVTGCGKTMQINLLAVARNGTYPEVLATLPGTTRSDPSAQRDTEAVAALTLRKAIQACMAEPTLLSADLLGYLDQNNQIQKKDAGRGWFEMWHFWYCDNPADVQVAFLPTAAGGYEIRARVPEKPKAAAPAPTKIPAAAPAAKP